MPYTWRFQPKDAMLTRRWSGYECGEVLLSSDVHLAQPPHRENSLKRGITRDSSRVYLYAAQGMGEVETSVV